MPTSTVSLSWNANAESNIAGYKIYAGRTTGTYTASGSPVDVGNSIEGTFTINDYGFWFFAITAYNTALEESGFSSETSRSYFLVDVNAG